MMHALTEEPSHLYMWVRVEREEAVRGAGDLWKRVCVCMWVVRTAQCVGHQLAVRVHLGALRTT